MFIYKECTESRGSQRRGNQIAGTSFFCSQPQEHPGPKPLPGFSQSQPTCFQLLPVLTWLAVPQSQLSFVSCLCVCSVPLQPPNWSQSTLCPLPTEASFRADCIRLCLRCGPLTVSYNCLKWRTRSHASLKEVLAQPRTRFQPAHHQRAMKSSSLVTACVIQAKNPPACTEPTAIVGSRQLA